MEGVRVTVDKEPTHVSITLFHHPYSRAANNVWSLEEVGVPYALRWVDFSKNEQKSPELIAKNPMGKLPTLVDGELVVTESAAISLYLGDRYAYGTLTPRVDEPARGTYLRWSLFAPSVIEPACLAKAQSWTYRESAAGFGTFEAMLAGCEQALSAGDYILGDRFSMADCVVGGTLRYMVMFKLIEPRPLFTRYIERITARPAWQRAEAKNAAVREAHGLK